MDYMKLLKRANDLKPKSLTSGERFEPPEADIIYSGNKTIIVNFGKIASVVRREKKHIAKYLFKELAAPGDISGNELIILSKLPRSMIRKKLESYMKEYVICPQCGKPDTKIIKEGGMVYLKCEACGAKKFIKKL